MCIGINVSHLQLIDATHGWEYPMYELELFSYSIYEAQTNLAEGELSAFTSHPNRLGSGDCRPASIISSLLSQEVNIRIRRILLSI